MEKATPQKFDLVSVLVLSKAASLYIWTAILKKANKLDV